jgi:uncharacterized protein
VRSLRGSTGGGAPDPEGASTRVPTVVVSRRARPGADVELAAALAALVARAETAPGFLDAQVQPPDAAHPGEWVVVYRFTTFEGLERWLASDERTDALHHVDALVDGPVREQVVAVPGEPDPVTAVSAVRVRPGSEDAYRTHHRTVVRALEQVPGFRRAELLDPVDGRQREIVTVMVFDDRDSLQAWLDSDVRRQLLAELDPLVEGDRSVNVVGGWAGWFAPDGPVPGPPRWKQALVVLLALFPVSLGLSVGLDALVPGLPLVPSVLVGNVIGIAVLTWVLMPWLTRLLRSWLNR